MEAPATHSGISLQKTYLSITDNCTQSSGDINTRKNNFHDLDTCSGQKVNLSLTDKTAGFSC